MATEKRLIDANEAYEIARTSGLHDDFGRCMADLTSLRELLEDIPTVDAVEVVHGEWLEEHGFDAHNNEYWVHCCSVCEEQALVDVLWREEQLTDYCPYCGAKMNGGKSEQT